MRHIPLAGGRRPPGVLSDLHQIRLAVLLGLASAALVALALVLT